MDKEQLLTHFKVIFIMLERTAKLTAVLGDKEVIGC